MVTAEELAKDAFENLKIEGKTLKEWSEEIASLKAYKDAIVPCRECELQHDKKRCYISMLCEKMHVNDDGFDEFWCKDGRRKKA